MGESQQPAAGPLLHHSLTIALMAATATASLLFFVADITFSLRTDLLQEGSACSLIPNHSGLTSSLPSPAFTSPL